MLQTPVLGPVENAMFLGIVLIVVVLFAVFCKWQREGQDKPFPAVDYDEVLPRPS